VGDGDVDEHEIAAYYGLGAGEEPAAPDGGMAPGQPRAEQERAEIRESLSAPPENVEPTDESVRSQRFPGSGRPIA
jgi:hypothetical protein